MQWDALHVRLLDPKSGELLAEHLVQRRGHHRIEDEDRPARDSALGPACNKSATDG